MLGVRERRPKLTFAVDKGHRKSTCLSLGLSLYVNTHSCWILAEHASRPSSCVTPVDTTDTHTERRVDRRDRCDEHTQTHMSDFFTHNQKI